jgi:hypothetical protein
MDTLRQARMRGLRQQCPDGWTKMVMLEQQEGAWIDAMEHCYDSLTAAPYSFGSVTQKTDLLALALRPDGTFERSRPLVAMSSGRQAGCPVASGQQTGWCAERKLLENGFPESLEPLLGKQPLWLFYLTRSPCVYCSNAIVAAVQEEKIEHLVVVFESFYGGEKGSYDPPSGAFLDRVVACYDEQHPGIELFKVHRSAEDTRACMAAEAAAVPSVCAGPTRAVYRLGLDIDDSGAVTPVRSRRWKRDVTSGPLGRDSRTFSQLKTARGDLVLASGEVKDPLVRQDPTLRFRRIMRASDAGANR